MKVIIEIIGYLACFISTFASLPQLIKCVRSKSTKDISYITVVMIQSGCSLWLVYGVYVHDVPLIVSDAIAILLYTLLGIFKWYNEWTPPIDTPRILIYEEDELHFLPKIKIIE